MSTFGPIDPDDAYSVGSTGDDASFPAPTHLPTEDQEGGIYEDAPKVPKTRGRRAKGAEVSPRKGRSKDKLTPAPRLSVVGSPPRPTALSVVAVVPAMTNFDFLEGSYVKVRQSRLILELVAGAIGAIMILIVALGLTAGIHTSSDTSESKSLQSLAAADNAKYSAATGLGSITGITLSADLGARTGALKAALDSTTNIANIIQQFYSLSGNGITITSIAIVPTPATPTATTTTVFGATTSSTTATTSPVTTPLTTTAPMNITVVTSVKNYDDYTTLITEIKNLGPYITNVSTVPSGGVPAITVTITAEIIGLPAHTPSSFTSLGGKIH